MLFVIIGYSWFFGFSQRCLKQNLKRLILAACLAVKTGFCLTVNVEVRNEILVSLTVNLKENNQLLSPVCANNLKWLLCCQIYNRMDTDVIKAGRLPDKS